jgi:hypothetical protein
MHTDEKNLVIRGKACQNMTQAFRYSKRDDCPFPRSGTKRERGNGFGGIS